VAPDRRRGSKRELGLEHLLIARQARQRRARRRRRRGVVSLVALFLVSSVALILATAAFTLPAILSHSCTLNDLRQLSLGSNSILKASDGQVLGIVPSATNRQPLPLRKMSPWLPKATVAIEDARFWHHGALDYQGILRAVYDDLTSGSVAQGGSTLTQQLVRNLYIGHPEKTFTRKLKEACLAEKFFTNRQAKYGTKNAQKRILAAYLNTVFYGHSAYGVQAAARTYFSKDALDLNLVQAALISGLPQAPSLYDPLVYPKAALARRNDVLHAMWKNHKITHAKYKSASAKPLLLRPGHLYTRRLQPTFFSWATRQLKKQYGNAQVERGGLTVKTTLDPRLQGLALQAAQTVLRTSTDPATAIVAIDPRTGAVKAMVNYFPDGRNLTFNLATQAHRSTGSAFKPITLATALAEGVSLNSTFYGPSEIYITDPQCQTNNGPWDVSNSGDESVGTANLINATAGSVNTIFAQLIAKVGVTRVVQMAHWMGITTRGADFPHVCAITLGSVGFTPLELTDVYATIASGGIHHAPQWFDSVQGPNGKLLGKISTHGREVLAPDLAAQLTYAMTQVVNAGTGTAASLYPRPVAGKTGTAENYQDAWFCGFVPQLVTCVWVGYPSGEIPLVNVEGVGSVFGGTLPAQIWRDFMSPATAPWPIESFPTVTSFPGTYISGDGTYTYAPTTYYTTPTTTTP